MLKHFSLLFLLFSLVSCGGNSLTIEVTNDTTYDKCGEIVEYSVDNAENLVVYNQAGQEIPSQVVQGGNIIFPATVEAGASAKYYLREGKKSDYQAVACGRFYPEKMGDLAWENDKIGFRVYGKPYEEIGSTLYGYDLFTKRGAMPVLGDLYGPEIDPENVAKYKSLLVSDPEAAAYYIKTISYHLDHGKGMDYYTVGPTLGCGTSALVASHGTVYQTYFSDFEIIDNGPLRFSMRVNYDPIDIDGQAVSESRLITLDAGTNFNKIEVTYNGVTKPTKVIAGIVLHDKAELHEISDHSVAYIEPMHDSGWQTYTAVLFGDEMKGGLDMFNDERRASHGGAYGHIQAEGIYNPGDTLTYYMGAGWNGWEFESYDEWFETVRKAAATLY